MPANFVVVRCPDCRQLRQARGDQRLTRGADGVLERRCHPCAVNARREYLLTNRGDAEAWFMRVRQRRIPTLERSAVGRYVCCVVCRTLVRLVDDPEHPRIECSAAQHIVAWVRRAA